MIDDIKRIAGPYKTAGQTQLPFYFQIFDPTDIYVAIATSEYAVDRILTYKSDYTVLMNEFQNTSPGGTVILNEPIVEGQLLVVGSAIPYNQTTQLTNFSRFPPDIINTALDRIVVQIQQLKEESDRTVKVPATSSASPAQLLVELLSARDSSKLSAEEAAQALALCEEIKQNIFQYSWDIPHVVDNLSQVEAFPYDGYFWVRGHGNVGSAGEDISNRVVKASGSSNVQSLGAWVFQTGKTFKSVEEMKASVVLAEGMACMTLGYYEPGDGGMAFYRVRKMIESDADDGGSVITLQNGLCAELIIDKSVNPVQFGAFGDGEADDTDVLRTVLKFSSDNGVPVFIPYGNIFRVTGPLNLIDGVYTDLTLNIVGCKPARTWEYAVGKFGGIKVEDNVDLFKSAKIYGTIKNCSICGQRSLSVNFFNLCDVGKFSVIECNISQFGAFLCDSFMNGGSYITESIFLTVYYFHRAVTKNVQITDSLIANNYINGGEELFDNNCFESSYMNGTTLIGNFIDFYNTIFYPKKVNVPFAFQGGISVGNQYQVFRHLYDFTQASAAVFTSVSDCFNHTDPSSNAHIAGYTRHTYVGRDGATYEAPPTIAWYKSSYKVSILNAIHQSKLGNCVFVQGNPSDHEYAKFKIEFVGENRFLAGKVAVPEGSTAPFYNAGIYKYNNPIDVWFIEPVEALPLLSIGWSATFLGKKVLYNNKVYKATPVYDQEAGTWSGQWIETTDY